MGMDNVDNSREVFEFSSKDIGTYVYLNAYPSFLITDVLANGRIELASNIPGYMGLSSIDRFYVMRGLADDELYNEYRFDNGISLKIDIKGVDDLGRKILVASVISPDESIGF